MAAYTGVSMYLRVFNASIFRVICGTGFVLQAYVTYLSRIKLDDYQKQIEPLYEKQVDAYEKFFTDDYDDYA